MQQPAISGCRNAVQVHVSAHDRADTGVHGTLKGGEIDIAKLCVGKVDGIVVAASFCSPIANKMLCGSDDVVRGSDVRSLKAANLSCSDRTPQVRIRSRALDNATPSRISRYVHHRCECPVNPDSARFLCRRSLCPLYGVQIPRRRQSNRDGKNSSEAMNYIEAE